MLKKFHWGHGIFVFYVFFVVTLMIVLIASTRVDRSLVLDDYYALDLDYQNRYNDISNELDAEHLKVSYSAKKDEIILLFDHEDLVKGIVHLYRPSNKYSDKKISIVSNSMVIPVSEMEKGLWKIKVQWTADDKNYYKVEQVYI